jgi:hypothetical protein
MECPNCHHWNEAGSRFCEECGFELTGAADAPAKVSITGGISPAAPIAAPAPLSMPPPADPVPPPPPQILVPNNAAPPPPPAITFAGARLTLEVTGSVFKLGDTTLIGREDPSLQIDFDGYEDGKYISHRHAQIVKHDGAYYIEDLGSSNHTRVNGAKISPGQSQPLKEGDKIRFGKIEVTFHES